MGLPLTDHPLRCKKRDTNKINGIKSIRRYKGNFNKYTNDQNFHENFRDLNPEFAQKRFNRAEDLGATWKRRI